MSSVVIRPFEEADREAAIAALLGLQDHEWALHDTRAPVGPEAAERHFEGLLRLLAENRGILLVAEAATGGLVGLVSCLVVREESVLETEDSNVHGYVESIYVAPQARGSGLGQALLAAAERHLAKTGVRRMRINALAANAPARRAYERYGFEPYEIMHEKRL